MKGVFSQISFSINNFVWVLGNFYTPEKCPVIQFCVCVCEHMPCFCKMGEEWWRGRLILRQISFWKEDIWKLKIWKLSFLLLFAYANPWTFANPTYIMTTFWGNVFFDLVQNQYNFMKHQGTESWLTPSLWCSSCSEVVRLTN